MILSILLVQFVVIKKILKNQLNIKSKFYLEKRIYRFFFFLSRVEHATRYNRKVKSGEILPHIPEWERKKQRKLLEKEQKQKLREERLKRQNEKRNSVDSKWSALYENNGNPYNRVFEPRRTKIGERIEQELKESLE